MARCKVDFSKFYRTFPLNACPDIVGTFYVPIQLLVDKPMLVSPDMGRMYGTEFYLVDGCEAVDWNDLIKLRGKDFAGTDREKEVVIVEAWHQAYAIYCLCGFFFAIKNDVMFQNPLSWHTLSKDLLDDYQRQIDNENKRKSLNNGMK